MNDFEKLMFMYCTYEGTVIGEHERDRFEPIEDDNGNTIGIKYTKDGHICFERSREELLFNYITVNWGKV